ncbi:MULTISPECIES: Gfo/Idh/MocA family protein [unclassified Aureimonas]|uniref:Gfo/Idh/MocA family protein n=1 Tax=unclassified Aureimonas TaxID=2615206 RepID=UPI0006FAB589|nr:MULTISPECIES: Gfo/Idh/MocA family oxidoreductase [unclassified Aureimonas]KQT64261.1 inositol 2-dehydrogenase [Aureimonas sp. Leaf427]KQT81450.1 inositol 2-dehydrogenase [Aureimonas sp. Leaf460]
MTLKIGVIGTGAIGQEHIARLHGKLAGSAVVAVNDINPDSARSVADRLCPGAAVHATGQGVVSDPNVDAVVVTSWGPSHEEFVLASIAAGKPVFCEKPLATTAEACLKIVEAEIASGRHLVQVGFMRRYDAGYRALKEVLSSGEIGEALLLHCAHRNPTVPAHYVGDMGITDTFIHEIDVLRWLVGDDYVSAQVIQGRKSRHAHAELDDPYMIVLKTRSGIVIDTEVFVNCQFGYDIQCQVVGEDGTANLPEPSAVPMRKGSRSSQSIMMDWKLRFIDSYDVELQEWIVSTTAGRVDGPTAWDGYFAAVTSDACVEAKRTGGIVPIEVKDKPAFYA